MLLALLQMSSSIYNVKLGCIHLTPLLNRDRHKNIIQLTDYGEIRVSILSSCIVRLHICYFLNVFPVIDFILPLQSSQF